jgi:hypothetical protein
MDINNMKVYLFGSSSLTGIPQIIEDHIKAIMVQAPNTEFIVGDGKYIDADFQKCLSGIGARSKSKVYAVTNARSNKFELDTKIFDLYFDEEKKEATIAEDGKALEIIDNVKNMTEILDNQGYRDFTNKQMTKDCDFAICYYDGKTRSTMRKVDRLKALGKYVYVYTAQID